MKKKILKLEKLEKQEKRNSVSDFKSLVTYLDSSTNAIKEVERGNFDKAKWILKNTANEKLALKKSSEYIDMMNEENSYEIVEEIRKEAFK